MTQLEQALLDQILNAGLPKPEQEWPTGFGKTRFDFAWPEFRLAVEVEGGTWTRGRHSRGAGFARDCEKYNAATTLGWRVIRVTADMVRSGKGLRCVKEAWDSLVAGPLSVGEPI